ncbi:MAG: pseudouridine-5'-phosphate glycosidase, partial [Caldilineaceae bacterium]|nr:pseudouridine-5'-phosphate glycosidase [Caldilineaceae bacterium]
MTHPAAVALESTVISHGLPYPQNLELARDMEAIVRRAGAEPRTVGIIGGELVAGLNAAQIEHLATATAPNVRKVSRRDLPIVRAQHLDGSTTVATTMWIAHRAGITVFATGGIGGVHRGNGFDISADLQELAQTPVIVVCAGAKAILDLPATLEYLETFGVTVVGWQTDEFPAFYSRSSGLPVDV